MLMRVESTHHESRWHSASAFTRLRERDSVRRGGTKSYNITTACTRPRISVLLIVNVSVAALDARRVMPGVMSPLRVSLKKSPAAPQLNDAELVWIMREAG